MSTFKFERACKHLFQTASQRGYRFNEEAFAIADTLRGTNNIVDPKFSPIERTNLCVRMWEYFGTNVFQWLTHLKSSTKPDWHLITIDPDTSPLDADDWYLAATSLPQALGFVLQGMEQLKARPTGVRRSVDGVIEIDGEAGSIAQIKRLEFAAVSIKDSVRAANAIRGLHKYESEAAYQRAFSNIHGLDHYRAKETETHAGIDRECWHVTTNNLCTSLQELLREFTSESIPRHVVQEMTAEIFGYQTWNHLKAAEKKAKQALNVPHYIAHEKADGGLSPTIAFFNDLPSALFAYGQKLKGINSPEFRVFTSRYLSTDVNKYRDFSSTDSYIALHKMHTVENFEDDGKFTELANNLLSYSDSLENDIQKFMLTDEEPLSRLIEFNKREGCRAQDHLEVCGWVFWVDGKSGTQKTLYAECLDRIGTRRTEDYPPCAMQYKAALVEPKPGEFWLAIDWDREPRYWLEGLDEAGATLIEKKLLSGENWRSARIVH